MNISAAAHTLYEELDDQIAASNSDRGGSLQVQIETMTGTHIAGAVVIVDREFLYFEEPASRVRLDAIGVIVYQ